jgi:hypothetical protein
MCGPAVPTLGRVAFWLRGGRERGPNGPNGIFREPLACGPTRQLGVAADQDIGLSGGTGGPVSGGAVPTIGFNGGPLAGGAICGPAIA